MAGVTPLWVQAVLSAGILAVIAIRDLVQGEPWSALLFTGLGLLILLGWWRGWSWFGKSRTWAAVPSGTP